MKRMSPSRCSFTRAAHGGLSALQERTPELRALSKHSIAVFGLGCIGAPSAFEFARAGVSELKVLDHDFVDAATTCRWPLGMSAAGLLKANVVAEQIELNYPGVKVLPHVHRLGGVRYSPDEPTDSQFLELMMDGVSLVYDATAEVGVNHLLSDFAREANIPYVGLSGTQGGWGGRIYRVVPGRTPGCWMCYRLHCADGVISEPPTYELGTTQPAGCADPTFTGAGFDMVQIALHGVRTAVSTLCETTPEGYPTMGWDVTHIDLRTDDGTLIPPTYRVYNIEKHVECRSCSS